MGPDWTDDYSSPPTQGPAPPPASPPDAPGPGLPTEHPPLHTQNLNSLIQNVSQLPLPAGAPRARAGLAILLSAIGAGVGAALGGLQGAGAGFLITGGARNLYRAQAGLGSSENGESAKSLTIGILGLAAGGYLVYRCFAKKSRNHDDDD